MKTEIFHPGNAGLLFKNSTTIILVDGIYDGAEVGMSSMTQQWQETINSVNGHLSNINALIFTHTHADHLDLNKVKKYLVTHEGTKVYGVSDTLDTIQINQNPDRMKQMRVEDAELYVAQTEHDGDWYREDYHESVMIKMGEEIFFIAGDAKLSNEDTELFLKYTDHVDIVFANLYQLMDAQQLECIWKMNPDCVVLYHLPIPEDDVWNYLPMARQAVKKGKKKGLHIEVMEHMKWFERSI